MDPVHFIMVSALETNRMAKNFALVADIKMRWFAKPILFVLLLVKLSPPTWLVKRLFSIKVRSNEKSR